MKQAAPDRAHGLTAHFGDFAMRELIELVQYDDLALSGGGENPTIVESATHRVELVTSTAAVPSVPASCSRHESITTRALLSTRTPI